MKEKKTSIGLGDSIEKITEATGIKKVVKFLFGEDCGCEERKVKLNKWKPYIKCLKQREYNYLHKWFQHNKDVVSFQERTMLIEIYNRVFNKRQKDTRCSSCMKGIINDLKRVYNEY
jgi:hypothetical protein